MMSKGRFHYMWTNKDARWGWGAQNATLNNTSQRDRAVLQIHVRLV